VKTKAKTIDIAGIGQVSFERSDRAKRMNISVKPFRGIRVAVPNGVSFEAAINFANSRKRWIRNHLDKMNSLEREYEDFIKNADDIDRGAAKKKLVGRLNELCNRHGFTYNRVFLKNQKTRWGSCSEKNNINLNIKLVRLPDEMIDYVLMHELVHTRIKNHTSEFWQALERLVGDAKAKSKKLREYKIF
jgi:predicted metal-dependent hydrolase